MLLGAEWVNEIEQQFQKPYRRQNANRMLNELAGLYTKWCRIPSQNINLRRDAFWTEVKRAYDLCEGNLSLNHFLGPFTDLYQKAFKDQDDGYFDANSIGVPGEPYLGLVSDPTSLFHIENLNIEEALAAFHRNKCRVALARLFKLSIDIQHVLKQSPEYDFDESWK